MCGRFNVTSDPLAETFIEWVDEPFPGDDNYNMSPTAQAWIVRPDGDDAYEATRARWWLVPHWSDGPSNRYAMFNAKSETLSSSNAFKGPFKRRRCILPVSGFYEWMSQNDHKYPHYIRPSDGSAMLLAGLWDRWQSKTSDEIVESFTIVTTAASPKLEFLHRRQPVMLSKPSAIEWMAHDQATTVLADLMSPRLAFDLSVIPVSTFVSNSRNNGARCIDPVGDAVEIGAAVP